MKIGRNDPCHCGSGQKYKKCCAQKDEAARSEALAALTAQNAARVAAEQDAATKAAEAKTVLPTKTGIAPPRKGSLPRNTAQMRKRAV